MSERGFIVTALEGDPGRVTLAVYEKHDPGTPGMIWRHELTMFEMLTLHEAMTRALWHKIRCPAIAP